MKLNNIDMNLIEFKSKEILEEKLVVETILIIQKLQKSKDLLFILFSGGSTPKFFLQKLAKAKINWNGITISLADERFVNTNSEYSNSKFLFENLIDRIENEKPRFLSLVQDQEDEIKNLTLISQEKMFSYIPDMAFLGMGDDGHFASLFPNDYNSEVGLSKDNNKILLNTNAPFMPKKRVSFSLNHLSKSTHLFLFCTGEKKLNILTNKTKREKLPIYNLLESRQTTISIYWAP
jgi:6-phosphogluconolactonase